MNFSVAFNIIKLQRKKLCDGFDIMN